MKSLNDYMLEYKKQILKGDVAKAYKGLMNYVMYLRNYFEKKYPDYYTPGSIYQGYMDMTYFSFTPESLKNMKLKIAIVFIYEKFSFEVWLAAVNKQVQKKFMKLFNDNSFDKYLLHSNTDSVDSILECTLTDNPDFNNSESLTEQIEKKTLDFIKEIEVFIYKHQNQKK